LHERRALSGTMGALVFLSMSHYMPAAQGTVASGTASKFFAGAKGVARTALNQAVFSPTLPPSDTPESWLSRSGYTIHETPSNGDGSGREGITTYTSARIALYRNEVLVDETATDRGSFAVAAQAARYRIETIVERGTNARLSTRIDTEWRSAATPPGSLTVQAPYHDGVTWQEVKVIDLLGQRFTLINHTNRGFISLRAIAEDRKGNTLRHTMLRNYEIG